MGESYCKGEKRLNSHKSNAGRKHISRKEYPKPVKMMYQGKELEDVYRLSKNCGKAYIIYTHNLIQKVPI